MEIKKMARQEWKCPVIGCGGEKETNNDFYRPDCPRCGTPMVKK